MPRVTLNKQEMAYFDKGMLAKIADLLDEVDAQLDGTELENKVWRSPDCRVPLSLAQMAELFRGKSVLTNG